MTRRQAFAARDARPARLRHVTTPWRATLLVVAGLLLGALLTAPALLDTARRQPYGPARTVLVEVAERLVVVSSATRLDVPWRTLDSLVHGQDETVPDATRPDTSAPIVGRPTPPVADEPISSPSPTPSPTSSATPAVEPTPSGTPATPPGTSAREPTTDDPLRVWIAGDSMWERPGPMLAARLEATGVVNVVDLEYRYSTGLTRPDFFDWPAHAARQLVRLDPEVVLFVVGPNDSQPLVEDGVTHQPRTDGFDAAYRARVRDLMEVLAAGSDHVLWVGLPVMRDAAFDQRMRDLDEAYASQAAVVDGVAHVPTRALFADDDGDYAEYLQGTDGSPQAMRNRDGIHLSDAGSQRLVRHLFALLDDRHDLTD